MISYLEPSVVIVDDVQDEVSGVLQYYVDRGVGCKLFNADLFDGDEYPEDHFSDLSIIYLDLYYSSKFDAERCGAWIRHLLKPKSFYILVMWTNDVSKAQEVSGLLAMHNLVPFNTLVKSKTEYAEKDQGYNYSKLFDEINDHLKETPALEEILIWKKAVKYSSNEIIGNLTRDSSNIIAKLKKIIVSHGGMSIIDSADDNHKRNILFDALDSVLISNTGKNISTGKISEINKESLYSLSELGTSEMDKELNSWFHFKLGEVAPNLIAPGLLALNNHKFFKRIYSILDDPKLESCFSVQKAKDVLIQDVVMVLSRPCDIAQKKYGKNIKLLSGVIMYNAQRCDSGRLKGKIDFNGRVLPDSVQLYEHLFFDDDSNDVSILFDYRYVFSVPELIFIEKFENMKIFNKVLVSEVQVGYSSYSSRLGITQII